MMCPERLGLKIWVKVVGHVGREVSSRGPVLFREHASGMDEVVDMFAPFRGNDLGPINGEVRSVRNEILSEVSQKTLLEDVGERHEGVAAGVTNSFASVAYVYIRPAWPLLSQPP